MMERWEYLALISVQREGVAPPLHVLPSAKVGQQLRGVRLPYQCEITEAQLLKATPKSAMFLHFPRDKKSPGTRCEACELDVALLRFVQTRRKHSNRPRSSCLVKQPQLPPALKRLNRQDRPSPLRDGLR